MMLLYFDSVKYNHRVGFHPPMHNGIVIKNVHESCLERRPFYREPFDERNISHIHTLQLGQLTTTKTIRSPTERPNGMKKKLCANKINGFI